MTRTQRRPRPGGGKARSAPAAPKAEGERGLRIGEAARALGVEAYVLRFWETQFPFLKPRHTQSRHRFYLERDLELLRLVKRLLHKERFTIEGARKHIKELGLEAALAGHKADERAPAAANGGGARAGAGGNDASMRQTLSYVRRELESIHKMLRG